MYVVLLLFASSTSQSSVSPSRCAGASARHCGREGGGSGDLAMSGDDGDDEPNHLMLAVIYDVRVAHGPRGQVGVTCAFITGGRGGWDC